MRQLYIQLPLFLLSAFIFFTVITKLYLFDTDGFLFPDAVMFTSSAC